MTRSWSPWTVCACGAGVSILVAVGGSAAALPAWQVGWLLALPWLVLGIGWSARRTSADRSDLTTIDVVGKVEPRSYAAGEVILKQGDPSDALYILSTGLVRVVRDDEYGAQIHVADIHPGGFFGEIGLLKSAPRSASVEAVTEVTVLVIDRPLFETIVSSSMSTRRMLERVARIRSR